MRQLADIAALLVAALGALGTLAGAWAWWQGSLERGFWILWRVTQLATTALAAVALIVFVADYKPASGLFWLYMLLPIAVSIIAEQLRAASADAVLSSRDLDDAQAVGKLPASEQRLIVATIANRELAVAAVACFVIAFLALRVIATA
ncbi:MAG: hypothetical protein JHD03_03950 [Solirubrobacteraceae bacterium]|nr:hypothetical protein [Solirubrobacteraceae bacterium]MBJ7342695.1 hypothetical protein [Solirubrobacteraceae bacterium]